MENLAVMDFQHLLQITNTLILNTIVLPHLMKKVMLTSKT